jgi:uncharacterized protein (DUF2384 family)
MLSTEDKEGIKRVIVETLRDLVVHEGVTDVKPEAQAIVDVAARAIEVFGTREKALRWLSTPVRSLGDQTPLSLLNTPEGIAEVQDTLGRVEHGVW